MDNKKMNEKQVFNTVEEAVDALEDVVETTEPQTAEPQATGTPYWNGIQQDPSGGYKFTGGNGRSAGYAPYNTQANGTAAAKKMPGWVKGLIIFAVVCIGIVGLAAACSHALKGVTGNTGTQQDSYDFRGDYIGVLYLEGTITDGASGDGYDQSWILDRIYQMTDEKNNRGIMLHVNTPGGSAYATSEVYKALLDYKKATGNPVYVYMGSQATSGGYYVAMAADKIYANPECWTGSIGVIVGTLYDFSELMEKYGIKATNIVSGANKDMGAMTKSLTEEQIAILQSLVDDSFDRFVQAVVDGRGLSEKKVRELADGRIYTAKQALDGGLIDEIGTLEEALEDMRTANNLSNVDAEEIYYVMEQDLFGMLGLQSQGKGSSTSSIIAGGELGILMQLMEESGKVSIEFICPISK